MGALATDTHHVQDRLEALVAPVVGLQCVAALVLVLPVLMG